MIVTLWKCRRCGAVVQSAGYQDTPGAELAARIASPTKDARIWMHVCQGAAGVMGVTDLIGACDVTDVTKEID